MKRNWIHWGAAVALGVGTMLSSTVVGQEPTAEKLVQEIESVEMPQYDASKRGDADYRREYTEMRNEALRKKADLILQLYKAHPDHEATVTFLPERWTLLMGTLGEMDQARSEAKAVLKKHGEGKLAQEARYALAQCDLRAMWGDVEPSEKMKMVQGIREYAKQYPDDERNAGMLQTIAQNHIDDPAEAKKIWKHLIATYPDNRSAKYWPGKLRQAEGIGKPFELEFTDAITGTEVAMNQLKGKVVVIDFWATWCGPCIAEMPHMKELYAKYEDKGVEFIGVSLDQPEDQGGLEKLRNYCDENDIDWPQYYQGNYWSSEFSTSWGINSIPTMFILDKKGRLHSTSARGNLDTMIPELLGEKAGAGG